MNQKMIDRAPSKGAAPALAASLGLSLAAIACTPTIRVEAPREPIVINLNVKIDQEVRLKLDREVSALIAANPDIF